MMFEIQSGEPIRQRMESEIDSLLSTMKDIWQREPRGMAKCSKASTLAEAAKTILGGLPESLLHPAKSTLHLTPHDCSVSVLSKGFGLGFSVRATHLDIKPEHDLVPPVVIHVNKEAEWGVQCTHSYTLGELIPGDSRDEGYLDRAVERLSSITARITSPGIESIAQPWWAHDGHGW